MRKNLPAIILLLGSIALLAAALRARASDIVNRDFMWYWAAGRLLVNGSNPYDSAAIYQLERSAGSRQPRVVIMRNPPHALTLVLPIGLMSLKTAATVWWLFIIASIMFSVRVLWTLNGKQKNRLHFFAYIFAPTVMCIAMAQSSAVVLLGLMLFLQLLFARKPFLAGVCLSLCTIKPHLFLPFGVVLALWTISRRTWAVVAGVAVGVAALTILPVCFYPRVFSGYWAMLQTDGLDTEFVPNLGAIVRILIRPEAVWLQCLPAILACGWAPWYFLRRRSEWDWRSHGSVLLLVSMLVAPYSWLTDEMIVLPTIMAILYKADRKAIAVFAAINSIALLMIPLGIPSSSGLYFWTASAWIGWYLWAAHRVRNDPRQEQVG